MVNAPKMIATLSGNAASMPKNAYARPNYTRSK
jgi:hypothetical protein